MDYFERQRMERFFAQLPGWMFLLSGMALLSIAAITPSWLECRELAWKRDVMRLQAQRLDEQTQAYEQFHQALASDDPVLLERLAYFQLRLKPAGTQTLFESPLPGNVSRGPMLVSQRRGDRFSPMATATSSVATQDLQQTMAAVEIWLHRPVPRVGVDYAPYQPLRSRLVDLSTGRTKIWVLVAGLILIVMALLPGSLPKRPTVAVREPFLNRLSFLKRSR